MRLTIVSGANSNHFRSLCQFAASVFRVHPPHHASFLRRQLQAVQEHVFRRAGPVEVQLILYDLGLTGTEAETLRKDFPAAILKRFDYSRYPAFFDIQKAAGQYAWKPAILYGESTACSHVLFWCDAGNLIESDLGPLVQAVRRVGIYTPSASGTVARWCHPATLTAMGGTEFTTRSIRAAGCCAFDCRQSWVRAFLKEWYEYARQEPIIAPPGSDRTNHRQDQSLLSILYYQWQARRQFSTINHYIGFSPHHDID